MNNSITPLLLATAIAPLLVCTLSLLVFKKTVQISAFIGMMVCLGLTFLIPDYQLQGWQFGNAALSALLLCASAALVIIPGLYFNATLKQHGVLPQIVESLKNIHILPPYMVIIMLLGILPAVESLTGFGACLLLGVPVYCSLTSGHKAARLSMLSMNIMPWATLTLATIVGAGLAHQAPNVLSQNTSIISMAIFPTLGLVSLYVWDGKRAILKFGWFALLLGVCLPFMLYIMSGLGAGEAVGIVSGVITAALGVAVCTLGAKFFPNNNVNYTGFEKKLFDFKILIPYALLVGIVLITRITPQIHDFINSAWVFQSSRVKLHVLASPGIIIAAVTAMMLAFKPLPIDHKAIFLRSKNLLLGLVCFVFLSQIMLENHMVSVAISALGQLPNSLLYIASPMLGMFSGFLAGSGLGGNAMMMLMQQQIGQPLGAEKLFAAIQNSSAGHTAFTSLPFILLVKTILHEYTDDMPKDSELLSFGLKVASILLFIFIVTVFVVRYDPNFR